MEFNFLCIRRKSIEVIGNADYSRKRTPPDKRPNLAPLQTHLKRVPRESPHFFTYLDVFFLDFDLGKKNFLRVPSFVTIHTFLPSSPYIVHLNFFTRNTFSKFSRLDQMHLVLLYKMHIDGWYLTSFFEINIGLSDWLVSNFLYKFLNIFSVSLLVLPHT